ncbi:hypothetical protein C8R46DRAFT_501583 [Mycena filopes]|nr:hypothetical protein C8R46DRAFT_501583 [Mycena filopes]
MNTQATPPQTFVLKRRIKLPGSTSKRGALQFFPWSVQSAEQLFNGKWRGERWSDLVADFSKCLAVAQGGHLSIVGIDRPLAFNLASDPPPDETPQVAWALRSDRPFDPLVLVSHTRRIFIWNINKQALVGCIRDHGGRITSIAVHPTSPNLFATTSADFTTRIYNLDLAVRKNEVNPPWPPWEGVTEASAAHGTDGKDAEGSGVGRCMQLLVGGRSGGHAWDVLGAAFHPRLPLIATCGADRYVKIWRTYFDPTDTIFRDDKPLFSARITTSRVHSVAWLPGDLLLMHTAITFTPASVKPDLERLEPREEEDEDEEDDGQEVRDRVPFLEPGSLDVVKWLSVNRFFPPGETASSPVIRGSASDYQESKSYTLLATEPLSTAEEPISTIGHPHPPGRLGHFLLVYPRSMDIISLNSAKLSPRTQNSLFDDTLIEMTKRIRLDEPPVPPPPARGPLFATQKSMDPETELTACALDSSGTVAILDSTGTIWLFADKASG